MYPNPWLGKPTAQLGHENKPFRQDDSTAGAGRGGGN